MLKNLLLSLSLIGNFAGIYALFSPSEFFIYKHTSPNMMSCNQAMRSPREATIAFAQANGGSLFKTQDFLRSSDYYLRNIAVLNGRATLIYTASSYPTTCGWYFPVLYGGFIRITTSLNVDPVIIGVDQ